METAVGLVDNGFLPEGSPLEGHAQSRDVAAYPVRRVVETAVVASAGDPANLPRLVACLGDPCTPVRWWAAQGCTVIARGHADATPQPIEAALAPLERLLEDPATAVRIAAAEALVAGGRADRALAALEPLLREESLWPRLQALNVVDRIGRQALPLLPTLRELRAAGAAPEEAVSRADRYPLDLLAGIVTSLSAAADRPPPP